MKRTRPAVANECPQPTLPPRRARLVAMGVSRLRGEPLRWLLVAVVAVAACSEDGSPMALPDMALPDMALPDMARAAGDCTDGVKDGDETDVDCGGACGATCGAGMRCAATRDCLSLQCSKGVCDGHVLSFAAPVSFATGDNPTALVAGDVDSSGTVDLVVADVGSSDVKTLLGDGKGAFVTGSTLPLDWQIGALALGDLDHEKGIDLVVGRNASTVTLFHGNANGSFGNRVDVTTSGGATRQPVIGDLDGDGWNEIAVADDTANQIFILHRQSDGTYSTSQFGDGLLNPDGLAVGDINGDGALDLVVADLQAPHVPVLFGDGMGKVMGQTFLDGGQGPNVVRVADLDGDGRLDIVATSWEAPKGSALLVLVDPMRKSPSPSPPPPRSYAVGARPQGVAVADFNNDKILDVAADCLTDQSVTVYLGLGDGTFATPSFRFEGGPQPTDLVAADFDGDGWQDLAFCNHDLANTVTVLINTTKLSTGK